MASTTAFAQTTPATPPVSPPTSTIEKKMAPPHSTSTALEIITLTDEQAKIWIDKVVYSADGKNVGEVAALTRDGSGKVIEIHADIGGFLGLGQTRALTLRWHPRHCLAWPLAALPFTIHICRQMSVG
jgi:PRC-barrel domain